MKSFSCDIQVGVRYGVPSGQPAQYRAALSTLFAQLRCLHLRTCVMAKRVAADRIFAAVWSPPLIIIAQLRCESKFFDLEKCSAAQRKSDHEVTTTFAQFNPNYAYLERALRSAAAAAQVRP